MKELGISVTKCEWGYSKDQDIGNKNYQNGLSAHVRKLLAERDEKAQEKQARRNTQTTQMCVVDEGAAETESESSAKSGDSSYSDEEETERVYLVQTVDHVTTNEEIPSVPKIALAEVVESNPRVKGLSEETQEHEEHVDVSRHWEEHVDVSRIASPVLPETLQVAEALPLDIQPKHDPLPLP